MKKGIFASVVACVAAMSLSVAAFAAAPGSTNGEQKSETTIEKDKEVSVVLDNGTSIDAPANTFAEGVKVTFATNPQEVAGTDATAKTEETVKKAIAQISTEAKADIVVKTKIEVTATDADGKAVQPAEGKKVKVTVAYDGVSNIVVYVGNDGKVEFLALVVSEDKNTAYFETSHFSDFYMATVDEADVEKLVGKDTTVKADGDTNKPTDDKNQPTGVVLAIVPAAVAAAAVVVSKKRK